MPPTADPIALLEQGYLQRPDADTWLREMTAHVAPFLDPEGLAVSSCFLPSRSAPFTPVRSASKDPQEIRARSEAPVLTANVGRALEGMCTPGLSSLKQLLGYLPQAPHVLRRGLADSPLLVVHSAEGRLAVIAGSSTVDLRVDRRTRGLWRRIAIHLGAGCRLSGRGGSPEAEDVECVLTPRGRAVHARGRGQIGDARERLREAAKCVERARARRGRRDPEAALELWSGLFSGRWSLVDFFDSDGQRFLLARRNAPRTPGPERVTLRQRQVLFHVGFGWTNREVGYALGIGENTVATHLRTALTTLGLPSRQAWVELSADKARTLARPFSG